MEKILLMIPALLLLGGIASAQEAEQPHEQIDNMRFDKWYKKGGQWFVASHASERVWGTANKGLSLLGMNGTMPEDEIVAVKGEGKRACKLVSQNVLWAFAAGALYTGSWVKLIGTKGAEITWGIPFHSRPKALKGYYYYKPVPINYARKQHMDRKGKLDNGFILVALTDWDAPMHINTVTETFFDANDPHVIGIAQMTLTRDTGGYVRFTLPIEYRDDRTPTHVVIAATPSNGGDFFTGGDGSTLYLDEFKFVY